MEVYNNICDICGKLLTDEDSYFELFPSPFETNRYVICEDCAKITSIYDLYLKNLILMRNSPDDVIEVEAAVNAVYDDLHDESEPHDD